MTIVRLEGFDAATVRGHTVTISAILNALSRAGVEITETGVHMVAKPKGRR
jgi:hypothetical protein